MKNYAIFDAAPRTCPTQANHIKCEMHLVEVVQIFNAGSSFR